MIYITTFGGSVWHGPAEGDPDAVEDIAGPGAYDVHETLEFHILKSDSQLSKFR